MPVSNGGVFGKGTNKVTAGIGSGIWSIKDAYIGIRDNAWSPPGLTFDNPATSVDQIYNAGVRTDGLYYILLNGQSKQVFCSVSGSEGWALAMRSNSGSSNFHYGSSYWTDLNGLNNISTATSSVDIKNIDVFRYYGFSNLKITGSTNGSLYNANPLTFTGFGGTNMYTMFNSGSRLYTSNITKTRSEWISWFTATTGQAGSLFDNQPNCNTGGINADYTYAKARIGFSMNNEGDCNTNDSAIGFGAYGQSGATNSSAGGATWSNGQYSTNGWVWVR